MGTYGSGLYGAGLYGIGAEEDEVPVEECTTTPGIVVPTVGLLDVKAPDVKIDVEVCA